MDEIKQTGQAGDTSAIQISMTPVEMRSVVESVLLQYISMSEPDDLPFLRSQVPLIAGEVIHQILGDLEQSNSVEKTS